MSSLVPQGSSSSVFLTEARTQIYVPVRTTQQSLDDNPHFMEFLKSQSSRMKYIDTTGIKNSLSMEESSSFTKRRNEQRKVEKEIIRAQKIEEKTQAEARYQAEKLRKYKEQLAEQQKSTRLWQTMNRKIQLEVPEEYYEHSPLKPGFEFFKQLLMNGKSAQGLPIRIPEMLLISNRVLWLRTVETPSGPYLHLQHEFRLIEFHQGFPRLPGKQPLAVLRIPSDHVSDLTAVLLNFEDLSSHLNANQFPHSGILQRYIHCRGDILKVTRLFYHMQSKENLSTYAYAITATKAAELLNNGQWLLRTDHVGAVEVYPVTGTAVKEAVASAQVVVDFLQKAHSVRIECIVLDFMRDAEGRLWIMSCKGIKVDMTSVIPREINEEMKREVMDEQTSSIHCKMCLLPYQPLEVSHLLPFKMLLLFKRHTSHSGRRPFDLSHLRVNTIDFLSHWVRLCEICYLLVLHEYELMETERNLANMLNIPARELDVMNEPQIEQPNFLPPHLNQWRLLFYFHQLEFHHSSPDLSTLHLQYSLFNDKFCYQLEPKWVTGNTARYHLTRLYYFFAENNTEVRNFALSCESNFRITHGKAWENVIAQGTYHPFQSFTCDMCNNSALYQPTTILLFRNDVLYITVHLTIGIARDREVNIHEMPVSIYRHHGVFIPEQSYINSEPLPEVWMEVFTRYYSGVNKTKFDDSQEEMYTPVLNRKEIYSRPMVSTHVMHTNIDLDPFPRRNRILSPAKPHPKPSIPAFLPSPKRQISLIPSHKRLLSHKSHHSLSTTASSKVIYQLDSSSKLKSPTFLSPRVSILAQKSVEMHEVFTNESIEELKGLFGGEEEKKEEEKEMNEEGLKDTVSQFLQRRSQSRDYMEEVESRKERLSRRKKGKLKRKSMSLKKL